MDEEENGNDQRMAQPEDMSHPSAPSAYQRDAALLVGKLCEELQQGIFSALTVAVNVIAITDQILGTGAWASLSGAEREEISSACRDLTARVSGSYRADRNPGAGIRVLRITSVGDRADAFLMAPHYYMEAPLVLTLERTGDKWTVTDMMEFDTAFHILTENLRGAAERIRARRRGEHPEITAQSPRTRIADLLPTNSGMALELVASELEKTPGSRPLRYLRALCLEGVGRGDEAWTLWSQLAEEKPVFMPSLLKLALICSANNDERAFELYKEYGAGVPDDPRPHQLAGEHYEDIGRLELAQAEYQAAIERDTGNPFRYCDLARALSKAYRFQEAGAVLDEGEKRAIWKANDVDEEERDLFALVLSELAETEYWEVAEALAAAQDQRMATSAAANLHIARLSVVLGRLREALPLLKKAVELDPKSVEAYLWLAGVEERLGQWPGALAAADAAIKIDDNDVLAHYHRACALAQLGLLDESLAALKQSIALGLGKARDFTSDEALKPLESLASYEELVIESQRTLDEHKET